jgi:hypothetical protein
MRVERRIRQLHLLPWPLSVSVILAMTDEDLDDLDAAGEAGRDEWWNTLNRIVVRIQDGEREAA